MTLRVGCSGWQYQDWRGTVYPTELPRRRWFEHYQTLFDTVELNSTFYRLPPRATVDTWEAAAEDGSVYAIKLGAFATHRKKLRDTSSWLPNHLDPLEVCDAATRQALADLAAALRPTSHHDPWPPYESAASQPSRHSSDDR